MRSLVLSVLVLSVVGCGDGSGDPAAPPSPDSSVVPPLGALDAATDGTPSQADSAVSPPAPPAPPPATPPDASAPIDSGVIAPPPDDASIAEMDVGVAPDAGPPAELRCDTVPYDPEALLAERVGHGRFANGGDPAHVYHVTSTEENGPGTLRDALTGDEPRWVVFDVGLDETAFIDAGDESIVVGSNKTVDGRGRDIVIDGGLVMREGTQNVIISDVRLTNTHGERCTQDADVVSIRGDGATDAASFGTRDIWFHHVEIYEGGDGLIDVRGGSRITISWSHFHDHSKGFLLSMESADPLEGREMEITFHHDFFERVSRRSPQLAQGRAHLFNNYQYQWWEFGAASVARAQMLSEGNIYEARPGAFCGAFFAPCRDPAPCGDEDWEVSKIAVSNDWAADERGYVRSVGDLLLEDAVVAQNEPDRVITPSYPYELEPATRELAERIRAESGPRVGYCR